MQEGTTIKYLGDYLGSNLEESVHQTVLKRLGIAKKSITDIRTVIEDKRAEHIGGFNVAIDIWEAAVIPMLFNNADTWVNMQRKTIKVLDGMFTTFYRSMFSQLLLAISHTYACQHYPQKTANVHFPSG